MRNKEPYRELSLQYSLSDIDFARLESEYEITKLKVEYAINQAKKENIPLLAAIIKYTALHRYTRKLEHDVRISLIKKIKSMNENQLDELTKLLFLNSDITRDICTHQRRKKCFDYDIYQDEGVMIHFSNAIVPEDPFSDDEIPHRKRELKGIAVNIRDNYSQLKYVFSVSWIWSLEKFQTLMPESFNASLKEFKSEIYSLGNWGQFYRFDGTTNQKRMDAFRKNWEFPVQNLIGECSVEDFVNFYIEK